MPRDEVRFRRVPVTDPVRRTLRPFSDMLAELDNSHVMKLHADLSMDPFGVQIMRYMLQIVTRDTSELSMHYMNPLQVTFGNLPFISETDMYYKYMWGTHGTHKNGQLPDGVFVLELANASSMETSRLLLLYECDSNANAKKGTIRKVAMKIRQGVDGSTKVSETMPAVSVRANFDTSESRKGLAMLDSDERAAVTVKNSVEENRATFEFLRELCVAHLWTAYHSVLLLYGEGTMQRMCHNSDKEHLYDLNFFLGRFAVSDSMLSTHRASLDSATGTGDKYGDKHKRPAHAIFLNSDHGFFEDWSVLSRQYIVPVHNAANIKCVAIQRVNFEEFTNDLIKGAIVGMKGLDANGKIAVKPTTKRQTRAATKAATKKKANTAAKSASDTESDSQDSEESSDGDTGPAQRVQRHPNARRKGKANQGMWTLLDIWKLINMCVDTRSTIDWSFFSDNATFDIP